MRCQSPKRFGFDQACGRELNLTVRIEGGTRGETFEENQEKHRCYIALKISAFELYVMRGVGFFEQSGIYSSGSSDVNDLLGRVVP